MSTDESRSQEPRRSLAWHRCAGLALAGLALFEGAVLRSAGVAAIAGALAWAAWTSGDEARVARALLRNARGDGPRSGAARKTIGLGAATLAATPALLAAAYHFASDKGATLPEIGAAVLATLATLSLKGAAAATGTWLIRIASRPAGGR